jgi:hypothetical protein
MPEVLTQFDGPVFSGDRRPYRAQVVGGETADGRWEGWIEFISLDGGGPVRTPRETTQPNRADTLYWATGLSATYMEGALARALERPVITVTPPAEPVFDEPAPDLVTSVRAPGSHAVLDPFSVFEKGETLLRKELGALSPWHLVNIAIAYRLSESSEAALGHLSRADLVELIVASVRNHSLTR